MEKTLGNRLNNLMSERKLTGKQLAADIGVTEGTISKILTGQNTNPKSDTIIAFAEYFDVSSDYLLGLSEYKTPDANVKAVCEYTGLSENIVVEMHKCLVDEEKIGVSEHHYSFSDFIGKFTDVLYQMR